VCVQGWCVCRGGGECAGGVGVCAFNALARYIPWVCIKSDGGGRPWPIHAS